MSCTHNRSIWLLVDGKCLNCWDHYDKIWPFYVYLSHYVSKTPILADPSFHIPIKLFQPVIGIKDYLIFFDVLLWFWCVYRIKLIIKIVVCLLGPISHFDGNGAWLIKCAFLNCCQKVTVMKDGLRFQWILQYGNLSMHSNILGQFVPVTMRGRSRSQCPCWNYHQIYGTTMMADPHIWF